jgi:hypothetical protein
VSVSCVGTCSACGVRRFWLSDTLALHMDDGSMTCLRHPAESCDCETQGLTLAQASERGRLYRETFYVCRRCGRMGEIIEREHVRDSSRSCSVWGAFKVGWGAAAVVVSLLVWMRWWTAAMVIGGTLLLWPWIVWRENRRTQAEATANGLPRADAPGRAPVGAPSRGSVDDTIVLGRRVGGTDISPTASGACCDRPDWIAAYLVKDEDHVPCCACGRGVMTVSEHSLH